ncbi:unnamed protein product [Phaeothamnion confervicola]
MASSTCRAKVPADEDIMTTCGAGISIEAAYSNASRHLYTAHGGIRSERSVRMGKKKQIQAAAHTNDRQQMKLASLQRGSRKRLLSLMSAELAVKFFLPYHFFESAEVRRLFTAMGGQANVAKLPVTIHRSSLKHHMVEMYYSGTGFMRDEFGEIVSKSLLPPFHASLDLWTCKISGRKFCGVMVFYIKDGVEHSRLLSVKLFDPPAEFCAANRLSGVLKVWFDQVLAEFGISTEDVYSSTMDSGSDVKRLFSVLVERPWGWCIPHLCNCALKEAFGGKSGASACTNEASRDLWKVVKRTIEHINKSPAMKVPAKHHLRHHFLLSSARCLKNLISYSCVNPPAALPAPRPQ